MTGAQANTWCTRRGELKLARTVTRVPGNEKWNKAMLSQVSHTPYDLHVPKEVEVVFKDKVEDDGRFVDKFGGQGHDVQEVVLARNRPRDIWDDPRMSKMRPLQEN